jgi:hypothetical protein
MGNGLSLPTSRSSTFRNSRAKSQLTALRTGDELDLLLTSATIAKAMLKTKGVEIHLKMQLCTCHGMTHGSAHGT